MTTYLSPIGLKKLKQELEERKTKIREEINIKIKAAKAFGDLSENAEYSEAKEEQSFNEGRIEELDEMVKDAVMIEDDGKHKHVQVEVGTTIKVRSGFSVQTFTIVGVAEADPANGFISNETPLAEAFMGHKKGDEVEVETPSGKTKYKILDIK